MTAVASLANVTKRYHGNVALAGISLEIESDEAVALLGPNGSGKTTGIEILLGLRSPDSGEARLFGLDPRTRRARTSVGLTPQLMDFPGLLTVREVLHLVGAYYPRATPIEELLDRFDLTSVGKRRTGGLSGGQARRLALALAFVGDPQFVVLDEPTAGLDARTRRHLWGVLEDFHTSGRTLLLATHDFNEADALATRVVVIQAGQVIASGSPQQVRERAGFERVTVRASSLPEIPGVLRRERMGRMFELYVVSAAQVVDELVLRGIPLSDIAVEPVTLEAAFLSMVGEP